MLPVSSLGKTLVVLGILIFVVGIVLMVGSRFGLGQLPGDLSWRRGNTSVAFPIMTSIVLSIVLTVVLNLILRFFR
ncbi:MAG: hypothetical protein JWN98_1077 [Abditibacteriota bacterium]|nr:hypothetical protein [Abditibacteriota bacterium]